MQIRITRATFVDGQALAPGAMVDVDERVGRQLISAGKGVAAADKPARKAPANRALDGDSASTRDAG